MTSTSQAPEKIELARADDLRDVVHRAVACLAQGGLVALPTETAYGLAVSALRPEAVERVQRLRGNGAKPLSLAIKGADEVPDWVPTLALHGRRLPRRAWPGPVVFIYEGDVSRGLVSRLPEAVRRAVVPGLTIGLRSPAHPIVREVLRLTPGPLILTRAPSPNGQPFVNRPEPLGELSGVDMILDDGPTRRQGPATVVHIDPASWQVVRPGVVDESSLRRMAATMILFVCTGNTCRSPMAEALCKKLIADRLHCRVEDLEEKGFVVLSAGVAAVDGMPAASNAIDIVASMGGSLRSHHSRRLTPDLVRHADYIITMTQDHFEVLLAHVPDAAPRTRLLHPQGDDVSDPVGLDRDTYRRTAREIEEHLHQFIDGLSLGIDSTA